VVVTPSLPVKANSGVMACVPAAGKVLEGDDKPTLLREDQHYLHYITIFTAILLTYFSTVLCLSVCVFLCLPVCAYLPVLWALSPEIKTLSD